MSLTSFPHHDFAFSLESVDYIGEDFFGVCRAPAGGLNNGVVQNFQIVGVC